MLNVHLVFYQLDDRQDEVGVAQPAEDIVEGGHVLVLYAFGDAMRERRQYHTGDVGRTHLHVAGHGKGIVVGVARHTDDEVYISGLQHIAGLFCGRHLGERGWIAHTQFHILVKNFLIDASVILQHEGIIGIGHYQNVEDAARHQVDERDVFQKEIIKLLRDIITHHNRFLWHKDTTFLIKCNLFSKIIPFFHCYVKDIYYFCVVELT